MQRKLQELQVLLLANPRQAALLGALVLVAAGLWLRALATGRPAAEAIATKAASGAPSSGSAGAAAAPSTEAGGAERPPLRIPAPAPLTRDLFRKTAAELALSNQMEPQQSEGAKSDGSVVENPDQTESVDEQALARLVHEEAARLSVRSIVLGANPVAVIENAASQERPAVVRQGQVVGGFTVLRIEQGAVTLRKDGVTVRLGLAGRG